MGHFNPGRLVVWGWTVAAVACGGGSSGGGSESPRPDLQTEITLSGTITSGAGTAVDGDLADAQAPKVPNDTAETAQRVPSAVTIGGWADATRDRLDAYRAQLAAGQRLTLAIADAATAGVDLDLCVFAAADTANPVACSVGTGAIEQLEVATDGEYFAVVGAYGGGSNYTLTLGVGAPEAATLRSDLDFVPGEIVVRFRRHAVGPLGTASARPLATHVEAMGLTLRDGGWDRPSLVDVPLGAARRAALAALGVPARPVAPFRAPTDPAVAARLETLYAVKALRARADVETADPNYLRRASRVPNDPAYAYQWHYPLMNLPQAWDITTGAPAAGGSDVIVAVVDTGVFLQHPDLAGKLVAGYDFISDPVKARDDDGIDPNADDPGDGATLGGSSWHGTHVAGTVAASSDEGVGGAGVCWGARIMPVRVLGEGAGTSFDVLNGVRWAAGLSNASNTVPERRADVINLSLGGPGGSATEQATFDEVRNAGVVVVAAAGNENSGVASYPASYEGVISVAAVDIRGERAPYSNFGPNVDVAAPGGDTSADRNGDGYPDGVLSALVDDSSGQRVPTLTFYQGTSMAAPHVAGVAALMKAVCPALGPDQLDGLITSGAVTDDRGAAGRDDLYGHGLVNALLAVQAAQSQCGVAPTTSLRVTPARLDLAPGQTSATLTVTKAGAGALTVTGATTDASWLTITGPGTPDGFGAWTVTADPSLLADGRHAATITFAMQGGAPVIVPVTLQKGAEVGAGDAGYLYVLLLDQNFDTVGQASGNATNGRYEFTFTGVPAASYFLVAGSDHDDDGVVCDDGEACGAWPTLGLPEVLEVAADRSGLDFVVGFTADVSPAATSRAGRRGFALLPETKGYGGAR